MTLTQLNAFVLVARLGSVRAAARALGVSEPAVSQALNALRRHLDDRLVEAGGPSGMTLTPGGSRLLTVATHMVALGAEAEAAVRAARGGPEPLRLIATSTIAEFVAVPLLDAFAGRSAVAVEASSGVAAGNEMAALVANRLADLALGPRLTAPAGVDLVSEPVMRCRMVVVGAAGGRAARPSRDPWLVDPSGTDPDSDTGRLLTRLGVPEARVRVYSNQTAAWDAAGDGAGVSPAPAHLVAHRVRRGDLAVVPTPVTPMDVRWHATTLGRNARPAVAGALRRFLGTPDAMRVMCAPGAGLPPSHFRPPVYVTIWT